MALCHRFLPYSRATRYRLGLTSTAHRTSVRSRAWGLGLATRDLGDPGRADMSGGFLLGIQTSGFASGVLGAKLASLPGSRSQGCSAGNARSRPSGCRVILRGRAATCTTRGLSVPGMGTIRLSGRPAERDAYNCPAADAVIAGAAPGSYGGTACGRCLDSGARQLASTPSPRGSRADPALGPRLVRGGAWASSSRRQHDLSVCMSALNPG